MIKLPSLAASFVNKAGKLIPPWNSYLQQFTQEPPSISILTVGVSPFAYEAREPGFIKINGGAVSAVSLTRGTTVITMPTTSPIPVGIKDTVTVTYTVLPTVYFIPSYGSVPGG